MICAWVFCFCVWYVPHVLPGAQGDQKRNLGPQKLELRMVVSLHVHAGNGT